VIWRAADNRSLRIYTTPVPSAYRVVTLMHDPVYRLAVAWQNVAYNQPPHTSYFLGTSARHATGKTSEPAGQ
jgi:rhamnogalacturonan endolyase